MIQTIYETALSAYVETLTPADANIHKPPCGCGTAAAILSAKLGPEPSKFIEESIAEGRLPFFWSDLHLGGKSARLGVRSASELIEKMIQGAESVLNDDDLCVLVGDAAAPGSFKFAADVLSNIPGRKTLICGNNDLRNGRMAYELGNPFISIAPIAAFRTGEFDIPHLVVSHYPIRRGLLPDGVGAVFGHEHLRKPQRFEFNASLDSVGFAPVRLDFVLSSLRLRKEAT